MLRKSISNPLEGENRTAHVDPLSGIVYRALDRRIFTGASITVARAEKVLYDRCFGTAFLRGPAIEKHYLFDLASLTKPIVTAFLYLYAINSGIISPYARLKEIFPVRWLGAHKETGIVDLLSHRSGLPAYKGLFETSITVAPVRRKEYFIKNIFQCPKSHKKEALYSDLGYIVLGYILEVIFRQSLDSLLVKIFREYGLNLQLTFIPLDYPLTPYHLPGNMRGGTEKFVATSFCPWRKRRLVGEVDDSNCFCLGGVSGHAGLFGTSSAIHRWLVHLWNIYNGTDAGVCSQDVLHLFWKRKSDSSWVCGFDTPSSRNSIVSPSFSSNSVGHFGFTGTSFWMDLSDGFIVIVLTNRVYFSETQEKIREFRKKIHRIARENYGD